MSSTDRLIRQIQNAKGNSIAEGSQRSVMAHTPSRYNMSEGEQVFAQEANKQLALYKKNKGMLHKVNLSSDGSQYVEKDITIKRNLKVEGSSSFIDIDVDGTTNLDAVDIDGNVQLDGTLTIGTDGSGQDVTFYSDTSGDSLVWDSSAEKLTITGTNGQTALDIADGNLVVADNIDLEGDIDVNGTTNLDAVDIDGAVQVDSTLTVGVNDTGHDVKFFGATAGKYMLWDESEDHLSINGELVIADNIIHAGNTGTKFAFGTNAISFYSGHSNPDSEPSLTVNSEGVIVNQVSGTHIDFRVESDGVNAALKVDAGDDILSSDCVKVSLPNLPTSNPGVAGRLWNDSGTLKISAG